MHAVPQEVTPLIHSLLSSAAWWAEYAASPLPPNTPYFTALLWRRATVTSAGGARQIPFENSQMGEPAAPPAAAAAAACPAAGSSGCGSASCRGRGLAHTCCWPLPPLPAQHAQGAT